MKLSYLLTPLLALALGACGNDIPSQTGPQIPCNDQQYYDQVNDTCVPRYRDFDTSKPVSDADAGDGGSDADAATTPDADAAPPDLGPDMTDPNCDVDGDGALAIRCGGNDCDDARRNRAPGYPEICDDVDNDCNEDTPDGQSPCDSTADCPPANTDAGYQYSCENGQCVAKMNLQFPTPPCSSDPLACQSGSVEQVPDECK